jgi:hypothetical protein
MNPRVTLRNPNSKRSSLPFRILLACLLSFAIPAFADHFGDVDITPITIATGNTYHGYHEFRFLIENHSLKYTHKVTLIIPDRAYNAGNSLGRLSRTLSVGPEQRALMPIWQPPLPINGNSQIRVLVDDDEAGAFNLPDPMRHLAMGSSVWSGGAYYRGGYGGSAAQPTTVLVSRSLNFDDMNRAFNAQAGVADYSAQMAAGPPDSTSRGGYVPTAWMPAPSVPGPQWLELDYSNPQPAQGARIYFTTQIPPGIQVYIKGASGTNLFQTNTPPTRSGRFGNLEISFPLTTEPVKTVRLEFGSSGNIGVDALGLMAPSGNSWAATARASSEASGAYGPPSSSTAPTHTLLRCELPMPEWSESWLSYTPYDAVALSAADLKTLSPAAFSALWSYVECGGNVLVFGGTALPEPWRSFSKNTFDQGELVHLGLGRCLAFEAGQISALSRGNIGRITEAVEATGRVWQALPNVDTINETFPVIENYHVPVRSTVFIMLLFVLAIGPLNLIVLSRTNRRTWLLWTIPAISFLTCLLVFAYSFLREGVTPNTRIAGITILDQANRRAASIGLTAFYCPLTPSQGLFFSTDTEATPLVETFNYGRGTSREVDWTQGQHFGRGWVSARVPAHFYLRKSETRRERIEFETNNGQTTIVNGLGATIKNLWLADGGSHVFVATNIPAGQKFTLAASTTLLKKEEQSGAKGLLEKCGPQADISDGTPFLKPNTYVAELEGNPFFENGLGSRAQSARTKSSAVVFGTLESSLQRAQP